MLTKYYQKKYFCQKDGLHFHRLKKKSSQNKKKLNKINNYQFSFIYLQFGNRFPGRLKIYYIDINQNNI